MTFESNDEQRLFELKKLAYDLLSRLTLKRCEIDVMYLQVIIRDIKNGLEECRIKSSNIGNIISALK